MADKKVTLLSADETRRSKLVAEINRLGGSMQDNENRMKYEEGLAQQYWREKGKDSSAYRNARDSYLSAKREYEANKAKYDAATKELKAVEARQAEAKSTEQTAEKKAQDEATRERKVADLQDTIEYKKSMGQDYSAEQIELKKLVPAATPETTPTPGVAGPFVPGSTGDPSLAQPKYGPVVLSDANGVGKGPLQQAIKGPTLHSPFMGKAMQSVGYDPRETVWLGSEPLVKGGIMQKDMWATKSDAMRQYYMLPIETKKQLGELARTLNTSDQNAWNSAVEAASVRLFNGERVTPMQALQMAVSDGIKAGTLTAGGGGGATSQTVVNLASESDARALVNDALKTHLGRTATAQEQAAFYAALNKAERANPTISTQSGGNFQQQMSKGGLNEQQFAAEWGAAQEGAGEHAAATTYLDAFLQSLANPVNVAGV